MLKLHPMLNSQANLKPILVHVIYAHHGLSTTKRSVIDITPFSMQKRPIIVSEFKSSRSRERSKQHLIAMFSYASTRKTGEYAVEHFLPITN